MQVDEVSLKNLSLLKNHCSKFTCTKHRLQTFKSVLKTGVKFNDLFFKLNDLKETLATFL